MGKLNSFLLSAFIAISFYIILIGSFLIYLEKENVRKFKNKSNETVLELNIISNSDKKLIEKKSTADSPKKVENTIVKKSTSKQVKKSTDLKSLFKNVDIKASKIVNNSVNKNKSNNVQSRFKSKYEREKKTNNVELSKLIDVKNNSNNIKKKNISQNTVGENDKYFSKINQLILTRWYNYPLVNAMKYLVVVNITIDTQGRFSYHIVSLSGLNNVDQVVKRFLNEQTVNIYPIPPDGREKTIKINFKPDLRQ